MTHKVEENRVPRDRSGFIGLLAFLAEQQPWGPDPTWAPRHLEETIWLLPIRKASHVQKNQLCGRKLVCVASFCWFFPLWPAAVLQLRALRTVSGSDKRWKTSTWTQQTPGAFGNPSPLAYFTQTQLEGKNKFQKVQIILKAAYDSLLQSPQSLDKTKFILDVKTEELICSCKIQVTDTLSACKYTDYNCKDFLLLLWK